MFRAGGVKTESSVIWALWPAALGRNWDAQSHKERGYPLGSRAVKGEAL